MNWNNWVRQIHRWLSIVFTATVIANFVAMGLGEPPTLVVYSPLLPLFLLLFTGLYMFVLPYAARWRSEGRQPDRSEGTMGETSKKSRKVQRRPPIRPPSSWSCPPGGNPQIAKADGAAPVLAYIAAMPAWKNDVGRRLDALIQRAVPGVRKAVKWNTPLYGVEGQGFWFLGFHCFNRDM